MCVCVCAYAHTQIFEHVAVYLCAVIIYCFDEYTASLSLTQENTNKHTHTHIQREQPPEAE